MTTSKALSLKIIAFVVIAALGLAACGGDDDDDSASSGSQDASATTADSGSGAPVSLSEIDGTEVLVDPQGSALYTSEQEAGGEVVCVEACLAIWEPVAAADTGSIDSDLAAQIGTLKRPDGGSQLTYDGAPLYRFTEEGAGELTGDGLVDSFDGTEFTWQAASTGEGSSDSDESTESAPSGGGAYGY
jgi:predicted lipoprotein with Yx(FWY)xxD motif